MKRIFRLEYAKNSFGFEILLIIYECFENEIDFNCNSVLVCLLAKLFTLNNLFYAQIGFYAQLAKLFMFELFINTRIKIHLHAFPYSTNYLTTTFYIGEEGWSKLPQT